MRTFEELEAMVDGIRDAPTDAGVVVLIVRRPAVDEREVVDEARLDVAEGSGRRHLARAGEPPHTRRLGGSGGAAHGDERPRGRRGRR